MQKELTQTIHKVTLEGLAPIMFDAFNGHGKDTRPAEQKLYLAEDNILVLPIDNIDAFLYNEKASGCARAFEGKKGKEFIRVGRANTIYPSQAIPFTRDGSPIVFTDFDNETFSIYSSAPTTKMSGGGIIKQEVKPRPVLHVPWTLSFEITLVKNNLVSGTKLYNWFRQGGIEIALGTYRPRFGRFWATVE